MNLVSFTEELLEFFLREPMLVESSLRKMVLSFMILLHLSDVNEILRVHFAVDF